MQCYDEIVMSYSESRGLLTGGEAYSPIALNSPYPHAILTDGILVGHWRRRLEPGSAVVDTSMRRTLGRADRAALLTAVRRYGDYLGMPTTLD